jgi:hypothetical protein
MARVLHIEIDQSHNALQPYARTTRQFTHDS